MSNKPSANELTILKALWRRSPMSAKEVHSSVESQLSWSFSSTRKTLERMLNKGLLKTEEVHGVKVYLSAVNKLKH
ncbi:MAG: BlaI/MecI/CopY family transcriptional regulator [Kangiellaceae bacterium]|nr:BlaI/MecI/CopY family transcriptional regulator [Kangiellaceae bacterium]